jgi:hypothetical protein
VEPTTPILKYSGLLFLKSSEKWLPEVGWKLFPRYLPFSFFSYFLKYSDRPLGDELHPLCGFCENKKRRWAGNRFLATFRFHFSAVS